MSAGAELVLNGVFLGALYALFGLGLSLAFGIMKIINLAHGDFIVVAAFIATSATALAGINPYLALLIVVPAMAVLGYLLQGCILNHVVGRGVLPPLLLTFGLSIVIQNSLQEIFSADTRSLLAGPLVQASIAIGPISIGVFPLLIAAISLAVFGLTHFIISRTSIGWTLRAVADDQATARLMGINDRRVFAFAMAFVFSLIGIAGVFYGMRTPFSPSAGPERLLFAFETVVLGGLGSIWGTFLGGLVLGVAQVLGQQVNTGLGQFAGHLVFFVALLVRPQGLFAKSVA
jgi:branched-chain amino acid transport system permease protein